MTDAVPPAWAGLAGWFGLLAGLVWLADGAADAPLAAATLALFACHAYGLAVHLRGPAGPDASALRASLARGG
ncbi:hypothetical protein [Halosegnis marinus]|uniref:Uncharacterized protein n=1 Tax=Halosegnis marinus TaxID=3034023 RepID=A0ABD5ZMI9_9EURY|nr:hypothetical protein [Halosegnis sp. DT85]